MVGFLTPIKGYARSSLIPLNVHSFELVHDPTLRKSVCFGKMKFYCRGTFYSHIYVLFALKFTELRLNVSRV
jgi:hypothetical protein